MAIAGYDTIGASEDFDAADDADVNGPYTVGVGATINEIHLYLRSFSAVGAPSAFRPIIYQDNAGEPGDLISAVTQITFLATDTTGAWRSVTGLSVVSPVAAIWIGKWCLNNNHRYAFDTPGGNPSRYKSVLATYSALGDPPSPWPVASDTPSTQKQSVYVVYTEAAPAPMPQPIWKPNFIYLRKNR